MRDGYNIYWTENALIELESTIIYLETNWTKKELKNLFDKLEKTLLLISKNPLIFPVSQSKKGVKRVVILSLNTLYYRINDDRIEILSFFSNRRNPNKITF